MASTAPFVAQCADVGSLSDAFLPAVEAVLTIDPPLPAMRCG